MSICVNLCGVRNNKLPNLEVRNLKKVENHCTKQYKVQNNEYQNKTKKSSLTSAVFTSRSVEPSKRQWFEYKLARPVIGHNSLHAMANLPHWAPMLEIA